MNYADSVKKYLEPFVQNEDFSKLPIFTSLENYVNKLIDNSKETNIMSLPLKEAMANMVFLDIDNILAGGRTKIDTLVTYGDISRIGLKRLRDENADSIM
jgi:hypothetical protein